MLLPIIGFAAPSALGAPKPSGPSVIEYSQCQNGPVGTVQLGCDRWGNGILNSSNSHYSEDEVTPQRLLLSTTANATTSVTIRYMTKKGSANVHAYDSLATWNVTQVNAQACQGIKASDCPTGAVSSLQMESDPNPVNPTAVGVSNITAAHELPATSRQWKMLGGTLLSTTVPVHTADPSDPGSDYAKVTVTFRSNGTRTLLLFGGHLAASNGPRGWGPGLGASSISGGPYHIILDAINGASAGSRDNAIQAGSIAPAVASFTVEKSASPANPVTPGATVTYTITVTNGGDGAGATTFVDDFDDRLTPTVPAGCARETSGSNRLFTCSTGTIAPNGGTQTFTYTAVMPATFTTGAGTNNCDGGQFPVYNLVTLATGDADDALVCVTAAADLTVVKSAPATAQPGATVTYTITVTNEGDAAGSIEFVDNFDDRLNPSTPTAVPAGGSCTREAVTTPPSDKLFNCMSGVINAGQSQVWTYTAQMPGSFTGTPGGEGCSAGPTPPASYPVKNVVVLDNGEDDDATICVPASPSFTVAKTFSPANPAAPGDTITYTITITNGGKAPGSTTFGDNFDDRINPTTPAPTSGTGNCALVSPGGDDQFECTSGTIEAGQSQTWTYQGTMPTEFVGAPGGNGCTGAGPGQSYPVRNVVVLANGFNDDAVVCVAAAAELTVVKSVSPSTANPGQTVTYTITVSNSGDAPGAIGFIDDFDNRLNPSTPSAVPAGGSCTLLTSQNNKRFSCTSGTINPGDDQVWTYTAAMPATFTGTPGGNGCSAGPNPPAQFPVRNVVVLANGDDDDAVVCVNAAPTFTVEKSANPTTAGPGDTVTYTVKVTNGGTAAGSTTWGDNFDDRVTSVSNATTPGGPDCAPGATAFSGCDSGTIEAGASRTWTYTAVMPTEFSGTPGGNGCNPAGPGQEYPIRNVVVLANGTEDDAVVCVPAEAELTVEKSASPANATPGQTVTYTIVITNSGDAAGSTPFGDNFDDRVTDVSNPTAVPAGGSCTIVSPGGDRQFSCTSGVIGAGDTQTWTYTAKMPASFAGTPGGGGCNPAGNTQQFQVRNVVVLDNGDNDDAEVCVSANPDLSLVKSVVKGTSPAGLEELTYTLTYTNTGTAPAASATIVETIPAGTVYVSCTGGCTVNGDTVTWTVGPIAAKTGTGSVTLTVAVTTNSVCDISNTATISAVGFNGGNPVSSNTLVTPVTPAPDPDGANASGEAWGALVVTRGLLNVTTTKLSHAESSQHGVGGPSGSSDNLLAASVPAVLTATVLRTTSSSEVTENPPRAGATSTSEVLGLCILRIATICTVESSTVRAVARTEASGTNASFSALGSTIENLKIAGVATPVDLNQTTIVPLAALVFGAGSYVAINERIGGTSLSGGAYRSDLEVNMIRVHITGALGIQAVDVTVAHAEAHSDFPQLKLCGPQVNRNVSGHAFIAHAAVLPPLVSATVGFVGIPSSGGLEQQNVAAASLLNSSLLTTGVATTRTLGTIGGSSAASGSRAQVANICLLRFPSKPTQCVVTADAVKAVSVSTANSSGSVSFDQASATDKTEFLNLKVRLAPDAPFLTLPLNPAVNQVVPLLGIGYLVLNEQICDNGTLASTTGPRCAGATHSGLTVRSLHLVLLQGFAGFQPGVEVIVAEAHSDASTIVD